MTAPVVPHVPAPLVDRLTKVAGLLGSDHDGERAAAAYRATAIIRDAGLTWADVIRAAGPREIHRREQEGGGASGDDWRSQLHACLQHPTMLTRWETDFVLSLCAAAQGRSRRPSPKQAAVLAKIYAKVMST